MKLRAGSPGLLGSGKSFRMFCEIGSQPVSRNRVVRKRNPGERIPDGGGEDSGALLGVNTWPTGGLPVEACRSPS